MSDDTPRLRTDGGSLRHRVTVTYDLVYYGEGPPKVGVETLAHITLRECQRALPSNNLFRVVDVESMDVRVERVELREAALADSTVCEMCRRPDCDVRAKALALHRAPDDDFRAELLAFTRAHSECWRLRVK